MPKFQTLEDFLEKQQREDETNEAVLQLCRQLRSALKKISMIVACGPLAGDLAAAQDIVDSIPEPIAELGRRRSPREDIERQIRAAFAEPAERDGRFELRP